ncbi:hypothetical protein Q7378_01250 [Glaesserella parasuis]|uniref:hypothetical protein n=1 Tax=Glaesserella parasuis TaxID=738 RepID=UPI001F3718DC|nr:hypothetical protein [Glaesserella parasuis]MDO9923405.1 hypothetical protein [Glaesserella parasuis]MDO9951149.1 hypothetical protein [Glaesserella parasuis]MDP0004452.1 hypothetical protein [Glaesserella parasuis]MDP0016953.1 hypothetical protein [Glaesserella parasuis]MDP0023346.1 hypothetical protein [Glaesserella parasuis]
MKKAVLMGLVLALTVSTVQAKKAGGMKFSSSKKNTSNGSAVHNTTKSRCGL